MSATARSGSSSTTVRISTIDGGAAARRLDCESEKGVSTLSEGRTESATEVLRQAQDIRGGSPSAVIVLSMIGKNYRLTHDMKDAARTLDLPLAKYPLTLRQIYADAPGQGSVVWQMGARAREAADETRRLFEEILPNAVRNAKLKRKSARLIYGRTT